MASGARTSSSAALGTGTGIVIVSVEEHFFRLSHDRNKLGCLKTEGGLYLNHPCHFSNNEAKYYMSLIPDIGLFEKKKDIHFSFEISKNSIFC